MLSKRFLIGASLVAVAGCSDSNTGPTGLVGAMSFNYSGELSGTFNVTGQMPTSTSGQETSSWAAGEFDTGAGMTFVAASTPRTANTHDLVFLQADRITTGSVTINLNTCVGNDCPTVFFLLGLQHGTFDDFLQSCELRTGSIVFTETSPRIKGTFAGTGSCFDQFGDETSFTVTNGAFDVPVMQGVA